MAKAPGGTLYIISAPSGAGKTSLVNALTASVPDIAPSVSYTTRAPRPGEVEGRDYYFVDEETFEAMIQGGEFLEHARVFDRWYGTARAAVEQQLAQDRDVILEIDWQGARQVRAQMPEAQSVFILPPSREVLEARLRARAQDSEAAIERRLRDAVDEVRHYGDYDYLIVNRDFDEALAALLAIVRARRQLTSVQVRTQRELIARFLE